jgi:hypothetical protein
MKQSFDKQGRLWRSLTVGLGLLGLAGGLWLVGPGQAVSWAAPGQQPARQTIPTRGPSPTPSLPRPMATSGSKAEDEDNRAATPTQLPTRPGAEGWPEPPPPQPSAQTSGPTPGPGEIVPEQSAEPNAGAEQQVDDVPPVELERRVTPDRTIVETDGETLRTETDPGPTVDSLTLVEETGSLTWLYALILGGVLILAGLYLVNRA